MGMTAASTALSASAPNASAEREQGTIVASATSLMVASWLNEPGSPWMAIFIPAPTSPADLSVADVARGDCFLAPYHSSIADFSGVMSGGMKLSPQPNVGSHEDEENRGDHAIHGEESCIKPAQIARRNQRVFVGQQQRGGSNAKPSGDPKSEEMPKPRQQAKHRQVHAARGPKSRRNSHRLRQAVEACGAVMLEILARIENIEAGGPQSDRGREHENARIERTTDRDPRGRGRESQCEPQHKMGPAGK